MYNQKKAETLLSKDVDGIIDDVKDLNSLKAGHYFHQKMLKAALEENLHGSENVDNLIRLLHKINDKVKYLFNKLDHITSPFALSEKEQRVLLKILQRQMSNIEADYKTVARYWGNDREVFFIEATESLRKINSLDLKDEVRHNFATFKKLFINMVNNNVQFIHLMNSFREKNHALMNKVAVLEKEFESLGRQLR